MPNYSNLKIELMVTGENASTWGDVTNTNWQALEEAVVGSADVTFASANVELQYSETNGTQTVRNMRLNLVGTTGGSTRTLTVPSVEKLYIVNNTCEDSVTVRTNPGSGITVPAGKTMWVYSTGANVVDAVTHLTSLTLGSPLPIASGGTGSNTGNAGSLTGLNASNVTTGTLAVAYGGTGAANAASARVNLLPSYTGNAGKVLAVTSGATDTEWISVGGAGTVTSVNANSSVSGLSFTGGPITSAGTLTLTGTLGVQGGGTGTTSLTSGAVLIGAGTSAVTSVSPGTSGNVLVSNGSAWVSQAASGSGTVTSVSGAGTVNGITLSGTVTSSGSLTLAGTLSGVSLTSQVTGTLPAGSGGTGLTTPGTAGNVLTSNGSGWVSQAVGGASGVSSFNTRTGAVTLSSSDVTTALGYTPVQPNGTGASGTWSINISGSAGSASTATSATTATTATTANALNTSNNYQVNSLGVGTSGSGTAGEIRATNNITAYYSSDITLKENVADIESALDKVRAIGGKTFDWTDAYIEEHGGEDEYFLRKSDFGVIAQDVEAVFPVAVRKRGDGKLAVDYEKLCALAFQAIKELEAKVEALTNAA